MSIDMGGSLEAMKKLKAGLNKNVGHLIEGAALETRNVAESSYASADASAGNTDFHVDIKGKGRGTSVTASGTDVGFLEYGAGDAVYSFYDDITHEPGEWSSTKGAGMYSKSHFWKYKGTYYRAIPATHGMHNGRKAAMDYIRTHWRNAFR